VTIAWTGSDPDGDSLRYQLSLSLDGGAHWEPIGSVTTVTQYTWVAPAGLATPLAVIRVEASDGFNVGIGISGTFVLGNPEGQ